MEVALVPPIFHQQNLGVEQAERWQLEEAGGAHLRRASITRVALNVGREENGGAPLLALFEEWGLPRRWLFSAPRPSSRWGGVFRASQLFVRHRRGTRFGSILTPCLGA